MDLKFYENPATCFLVTVPPIWKPSRIQGLEPNIDHLIACIILIQIQIMIKKLIIWLYVTKSMHNLLSHDTHKMICLNPESGSKRGENQKLTSLMWVTVTWNCDVPTSWKTLDFWIKLQGPADFMGIGWNCYDYGRDIMNPLLGLLNASKNGAVVHKHPLQSRICGYECSMNTDKVSSSGRFGTTSSTAAKRFFPTLLHRVALNRTTKQRKNEPFQF